MSVFAVSTIRRVAQLALGGAALLLTGLAVAHECWLAPRRYEVQIGTRQYVGRYVGESFRPEAWGAGSRQIRQMTQLAPGYTTDLTTSVTMRDTLRTTLVFTRPGTNVLALRSAEALITLEGAKFNEYLREDGLETILAQRTAANALQQPGREAYSRCLKTLVRVGDARARQAIAAGDTCWRQVLNLPLELVPEQNPYNLRPGDTLTVRLLKRGRPAIGQLVQVWHRNATGAVGKPARFRSDLGGRIRFVLPKATETLVSSVRMTPHPARDSADWQSTWASLTFGGAAH